MSVRAVAAGLVCLALAFAVWPWKIFVAAGLLTAGAAAYRGYLARLAPCPVARRAAPPQRRRG
jgi:hypothetical protein